MKTLFVMTLLTVTLVARSAIVTTLGTDVNGVGTCLFYDTTKTNSQSQLMLFTHGLGQLRASPTNDSCSNVIFAILGLGYYVVASDAESNNGYGSPLERRDYSNAVLWAIANSPCTTLKATYSMSMGGVSGLYFATNSTVTHSIFVYPICDLQWAYPSYSATINPAYSVASYAAIPAGHDPMLFSGANYTGKRMLFFHSAADTGVNYYSNSVAMLDKVSGYATVGTLVTTSGDHGDASNFDPQITTVVNFLTGVTATATLAGTLHGSAVMR